MEFACRESDLLWCLSSWSLKAERCLNVPPVLRRSSSVPRAWSPSSEQDRSLPPQQSFSVSTDGKAHLGEEAVASGATGLASI